MLSMFISGMANAQVKTLEVRNDSNCPAFISIGISNPSTSPTCTPMTGSTVIMVPPMAVLTFEADAPATSPSYIPGTPAGYIGYILFAKLYEGPLSCATTGVLIGEATCGHPTSDYLYGTLDMACSPCSAVKTTWTTNNRNIDATMLIW